MKTDRAQKQRSHMRALYPRFIKRLIDRVAGLVIFVQLLPLLLVIYVVLRFSIGSPVLFRQARAGFKGKPFTNYKFRTMTNQCDSCGQLLPDEQRITKVGWIVRSYSLDELPQLINVLKGEVSLVGPRPLHVRYLERYTPEQARRHEVMPGITGWVQVNGRNALTWEEKFNLDVWYVDHQSFLLDLRILALTFRKVIRRDGISSEGFVAAPEFMGSNAQEKG
jgi:sugar transferase EpsL